MRQRHLAVNQSFPSVNLQCGYEVILIACLKINKSFNIST